MHIRPFRIGEEAALRSVFHSSIHGIASRDYSPAQIEAWAPTSVSDEMAVDWSSRIRSLSPFVVEHQTAIAAYGDLQPSGYIDHFYVAAPFAGQGVGSELMRFLLAKAAGEKLLELSSHVSLTAQPFFQRFGFQIVERRDVMVRGVTMQNALMRRTSDDWQADTLVKQI